MTDRVAVSHPQLRIDSHHHLWDLAVRDQGWTASLPAIHRTIAMDELRPALANHRIDGTVLVQSLAVAQETPELLALARVDPQILGVVGWVELTAPDVADRLALLADPLLVGIRHLVQDEPDPRWLCRPDVMAGIAAVGAAGLVYDLLVRPAQLDAATEVVGALPEVIFVVDHAAKPPIADGILQPWSDRMTALAAHRNVVVKLSGLVTEAGRDPTVDSISRYSDRLLDTFGPSRMMFGSDWPVCLLAASYDEVVGLAETLTGQLSPAEQALVFGSTAAAWYGLRAP